MRTTHPACTFKLLDALPIPRSSCPRQASIVFFQVLAAIAFMIPSPVCAIDQDDPAWVGVWTFEEGEGTVAADVKNGNDAVFNGDFNWGSGILGGTVESFGGGSIDVADSPSIATLSEEMTVAAWFRVDVDSNTGVRKQGAFLLEDQSDTEPVPNGFSFRIWTDQGLSPGLYGTTELVQGEWYHVAGTYDGARMEMYINGIPESIFGVLDDQAADWVPEWGGEIPAGSPLQLKYGPESFTGAMDEVMILNRALSNEEIVEILLGWDSLLPLGDCDFDDNMACDIDDINALMQEIVAGSNSAVYDMNADSVVNLDDRDAWLESAGPKSGQPGPFLPGDANLDGTVNAGDLNAVGLNWQGDSNNWSDGNFDAASGVTVGDLNIVGLSWQQSSAALASAVPEPSCGVLLVYLLGLCGSLRRLIAER